jgi:hypothetical protein
VAQDSQAKYTNKQTRSAERRLLVRIAFASVWKFILCGAVTAVATAFENSAAGQPGPQTADVSGMLGARNREDIGNSLEALKHVVARLPTRQKWEEFLNMVEADFQELYGDRPVGLDRQREPLDRLKQAVERMRLTLDSLAPGRSPVS